METLEKEVFKIVDLESGEFKGAYSRSYGDKMEFDSISDARTSNVHGMFEDKSKYKIQRWRVTYTLVEDDCDKTKPWRPNE